MKFWSQQKDIGFKTRSLFIQYQTSKVKTRHFLVVFNRYNAFTTLTNVSTITFWCLLSYVSFCVHLCLQTSWTPPNQFETLGCNGNQNEQWWQLLYNILQDVCWGAWELPYIKIKNAHSDRMTLKPCVSNGTRDKNGMLSAIKQLSSGCLSVFSAPWHTPSSCFVCMCMCVV